MPKFEIIVADPAWSFVDGLKAMKNDVKRSAESQYDVMSPGQIANIPVKSIANPEGCLLALWVPGSMLIQGLDVMKAWGFKHKQVFVWVKLKKEFSKEKDWNDSTRVGMGRLFRQSHEIALIGTSGKSVYKNLQNKGQRSVSFDLNEGHSVKPSTLQERLEKMFPNSSKIELFARRQKEGWTSVGNAINGRDINDVVHELSLDNVVEYITGEKDEQRI